MAKRKGPTRKKKVDRRATRCEGCGVVAEHRHAMAPGVRMSAHPKAVPHFHFEIDEHYAAPCPACGSFTATYAHAA